MSGPVPQRRRPVVLLLLAAALAVAALGGIGFALVERQQRSGLAGKAGRDCDGLTLSTAAALPLALPLSSGERVLSVTTQGKTTVAFATLPGGRDDIEQVRDAVLEDLKGAGYTVVGTDQEAGYEAEAELAGIRDGTLKVSPLCTGLLEVRYKIEG